MTPRARNMIQIERIADRHGVSVADILSRRIGGPIVGARRECFEFFRLRGLTLRQIGRLFHKDHAAVLRGIRKRQSQ